MGKVRKILVVFILFFLISPFLVYADEEDKLTEKGKISGDIFGKKGGYFHAFLSVAEQYSDNIYYTRYDKESDYITVISPGIWLALPGTKEKLSEINTLSTMPGGLVLGGYNYQSYRRYQSYLSYSPEFEIYSENSDENTDSHKVEGLFQYNFRGGLSIGLAEKFLRSHDPWGTGISTELDKYKTNLFSAMLSYDVSEKFKFRMDYANFNVDYDESRNRARDREDNGFSGYIFFKFKPKTSFFTEYEFTKVNYDTGALYDSKEHRYFAGLQWDITAKSKGSIKAGLGIKDFYDPGIKNSEEFIFEIQVNHQLTSKTSLNLSAYRRTTETTITTTDYMITNSFSASYLQRFTSFISGYLNMDYTYERYEGDLTFGYETKERKDELYGIAPGLRFRLLRWLTADIEYSYNKRDTNFGYFAYTNNTVLIRFTGSM